MVIGVDTNTNLIYQGLSKHNSHAVWPLPLLLPVKIVGIFESSKGSDATGLLGADIIFREDYFDPVTRIRKGRLYRVGNIEPWITQKHPMGETPIPGGYNLDIKQREICTCTPVNFKEELKDKSVKEVKLLLGNSVASTSWTISSWERISTNEDLLTIRATVSYGTLPHMTLGSVEASDRKLIETAFKNLENNLFISTPENIVDCCRDLCESILLAKIRTTVPEYKNAELGKSISKFTEIFSDEFRNVLNQARTLQTYHSRRKTEEKVKKDLRAPTPQDAELCVLSIGAIICDLGYGTWG